MFTKTEKGYLAITVLFLAAGSGLKAYRHSFAEIGPFPDPDFDVVKTVSTPIDSMPGLSRSDTILPLDINHTVDSHYTDSRVATSVNDSSINLAKSKLALGKPIPASRSKKGQFQGKVNLNRANVAELTQVQGLGEKTALAIVAHRKSNGPFQDLRDLLQVKGIGEKKLEKLSAYLIL